MESKEFLKRLMPIENAISELMEVSLECAYGGNASTLASARKRVERRWQDIAKCFATAPELTQAQRAVALMRSRIGDQFFYDAGNSKEAIVEYEASLALDPNCMDALSGIVAAYLQGGQRNPEAALPYAIRRAELDGKTQRDVNYIRELLKDKR